MFCFCLASCHQSSAPSSAPTSPPAPFAKDIAAFEAADAKSPPPQNAVLFLGSSSIRLWTTLAADFPNVPVINRGFGGSSIPDSTRYADRIVIPYHPRQIIFYAGDNDIAAFHSPQQVLADYQALVKKIHAALPETRIDFISIKPSILRWILIGKIREANRLIEEYSKTNDKLGYIDVFTPMLTPSGLPRSEFFQLDGLHLNRKGYELWREIVSKKLNK
jgi:lysophospholipase L1-like esterase